ncbi:MAG: glycosyltransferase [Flavobacteriales bacterium]|nr:glycosyltransferase [Flavobacteriales bacterium]
METPRNIVASVVVCMHNEEKYIRQCLDSLVNQTYSHELFEIIVIDDESNDNCTSYVQKIIKERKGLFPRINLTRIVNSKLSIARNEGIKRSNGDYIMFIDGDAVANLDWLEAYVDVFEKTKCDYSGGKIELLNTKNPFARLLQETRFKQSMKSVDSPNFLHGVNMAFRKEVFEQYAGFCENLFRGEETAFTFLIRKDRIWAPAEKAIVLHERHESFKAWWNIYIKDISMSYRTNKVIAQNSILLALRHQVNYVKSICFYLLVISSFFIESLWILALLSPIFLKQGAIFKRYGNFKYYFFSVFVACADLVIRIYYITFGIIKNIGVKLIPAFTSNPKVLLENTTEV